MANLTVEKKYVYIFTRQDISPEQQIVQSAHATLLLGTTFPDIDAQNTYFTLIGVRNLEALEAVENILCVFDINYVKFFEPDLNGGEITSIATDAIWETSRGPLLAFNLLRLK